MAKEKNVARLTVRTWTTALAATAPAFWLSGHLKSYPFLFSSPSDLGKVDSVVNVFALTGYLLAEGLLPAFGIAMFAVKVNAKSAAWEDQWEPRIFNPCTTALGLLFGAFIFARGLYGVGHPDFSAHAIGAIVVAATIVKWIPVAQRWIRSHLFAPLVVVYIASVSVVVLIAFWNSQPAWFPVYDKGHMLAYVPVEPDPFTYYSAKPISEFKLWDWMAAVAGGCIYFAAAYYWRKLDSSSEIEDAVPAEAEKP